MMQDGMEGMDCSSFEKVSNFPDDVAVCAILMHTYDLNLLAEPLIPFTPASS
jgi:hypothetical protein